jgi:hypothetical protein
MIRCTKRNFAVHLITGNASTVAAENRSVEATEDPWPSNINLRLCEWFFCSIFISAAGSNAVQIASEGMGGLFSPCWSASPPTYYSILHSYTVSLFLNVFERILDSDSSIKPSQSRHRSNNKYIHLSTRGSGCKQRDFQCDLRDRHDRNTVMGNRLRERYIDCFPRTVARSILLYTVA